MDDIFLAFTPGKSHHQYLYDPSIHVIFRSLSIYAKSDTDQIFHENIKMIKYTLKKDLKIKFIFGLT